MRRALLALALAGLFYAVWRFWCATGKTSLIEALLVEVNTMKAQIQGAAVSGMGLSDGGLAKIARREGFAARKYPDASGYSIGYGHFIKVGESFSEPMQESTAMELLRQDAGIAANAVRAYVTVPLTQNQFDALVSFVYNVGAGAFRGSTLLRMLNTGDYTAAAAQFDQWHRPAVVIARRDSEKSQFMTA